MDFQDKLNFVTKLASENFHMRLLLIDFIENYD
jgi:hypothetical protein